MYGRETSRPGVTPTVRSLLIGYREKGEDIDRVPPLSDGRLSKNLTLAFHKGIYQIQTKRRAYVMSNTQVKVREASTDRITIEYKGRALDHNV